MPSATTELVSRIVLTWWDKRPFSEESRARRKAKRRARRARRADPNGTNGDADVGEFLEGDEVTTMQIPKHLLSGGGIAAMAIGLLLSYLGVGVCTPEEAVAAAAQCANSQALADKAIGAINDLLMIGGVIATGFGKARSMRREAALEAAKTPQ
jgi:hypothetical protein